MWYYTRDNQRITYTPETLAQLLTYKIQQSIDNSKDEDALINALVSFMPKEALANTSLHALFEAGFGFGMLYQSFKESPFVTLSMSTTPSQLDGTPNDAIAE